MVSPATQAAAVMIVIQITLKSLIDMEDPYKSAFQQRLTRFKGSFAATTDEDHRGATLVDGADATPQQEFSDIGDKVRVYRPIRFINPGYMNGPFRVAYKEKLHAGPDINQNGARIVLHHLPGLLWC
jgi:hypothetical protein